MCLLVVVVSVCVGRIAQPLQPVGVVGSLSPTTRFELDTGLGLGKRY